MDRKLGKVNGLNLTCRIKVKKEIYGRRIIALNWEGYEVRNHKVKKGGKKVIWGRLETTNGWNPRVVPDINFRTSGNSPTSSLLHNRPTL